MYRIGIKDLEAGDGHPEPGRKFTFDERESKLR